MRALKKQEMLDPKIWKLHVVERIFYETGKLTFNMMVFLLRYSNKFFINTIFCCVFYHNLYYIFENNKTAAVIKAYKAYRYFI